MSVELLFGMPAKLKTLSNRLTAARAALLDNIGNNVDATISSRAADVDMQTMLARLTQQRADYIANYSTAKPVSYMSDNYIIRDQYYAGPGEVRVAIDVNPPNGGFIDYLLFNATDIGVEVIMDDINVFPYLDDIASYPGYWSSYTSLIGNGSYSTTVSQDYTRVDFKRNLKVSVKSTTGGSKWLYTYYRYGFYG